MLAQVLPGQTLLEINSTGKEIKSSLTVGRLEGKAAIVTGSARGIGEATVRLFVKHFAKVVIADIEDAFGAALAHSLSRSATFVHCDVSIEEDIKHLIATTVSLYGKLDVLINNAGVLGSQSEHNKSILNFDPNEFDKIMAVNVKGVALGMKHAANLMPASLGPHAYTANSKHAIVGLTKNAACKLGRYGIREVEKMEEIVRELATLKGATLKAMDIAEAALYLAS
ncbi:hypothetical protein Ancab_007177 [Ancistrocladus abbreviatus]